ncbi:hypothetical protein [Pantoea dispersa]|uniref:hypothetical protein n=1 Tax=Pantoea dispersa TaxID=59814 RepID=UPI0021F7A1C0|nr:hypothetical protein [Pantoea dispersa]UYP73342.1 hypothetical protein OF384_18980 [Pantoea dispersa]
MDVEYWLQRFEKKKHNSDRIILNHDAAIFYDFYSVSMVRGENSWLFDSYTGNVIKARKWIGDKYEELCEFDIQHFHPEEFRVRHYYKAQEFDYDTLRHLWSKDVFNRIKGTIRNKTMSLSQYLYNKQKMQIRDRMEILQFLVERRMSGIKEGVHTVSVVRHKFTDKFIFHPDKESYVASTKFYLDSLVESGDAIRKDLLYTASDRALTTIENHFKSELREKHDKYIKNLTAMITVMAFIFAVLSTWGTLVQAEILPKWNGLNSEYIHSQPPVNKK